MLDQSLPEPDSTKPLLQWQHQQQDFCDPAGPPLSSDVELYKPELKRWYILAVFAFFSMNQCLVWFTFSSVPEASKEYYGISEAEVDLLLNWGSIVFCLATPAISWLASRSAGLRHVIRFGTITVFAGAVIRTIPCLFPSAAIRHKLVFLLHIGQIVNGLAGVSALLPPSLLSATWFPESERSTATSIAVLANGAGQSVGFLIGPLIVPKASMIPVLLIVEIILAFIPLLGSFVNFPVRPATPPSSSAAVKMQSSANEIGFVKGFIKCMTNPSLLLLALAGGVVVGTYYSFNGCLQTILGGFDITPNQVGMIGFVATLMAMFGSLFMGALLDKIFGRSMKLMLGCVNWYLSVFFLWFAFSLRNAITGRAVIPGNLISEGASLCCAGFVLGMVNPIVYELLAEITYPIPEGTSAGIYTFTSNGVLVIMLFVADKIPSEWFTLIMAFVCIAALICTLFVRERYLRKDAHASSSEQPVSINSQWMDNHKQQLK